MSADILGTSCDQCRSTVQQFFTSTETRRLVRTDSSGQPPRLSHSSWTMIHPQALSLHLIVGSTLSVNEICILFWRTIINLKSNLDETVSGRRIRLTRSCIQVLPNWSVIFSSQSAEDVIPEMGFGMSQYVPSHTVSIIYISNPWFTQRLKITKPKPV